MVRISDKPMIIYFVYKGEELVYIGQTVMSLAQRRGKHLSEARHGRGSVLGAALRKHGEEAFDWKIHSIVFNQQDLDTAERHYIAKYTPRYNVQEGGKSNTTPWNKGRVETRDHVKANISKSAIARKRTPRGSYSDTHKTAISDAGRARFRLDGRPFIHHQTGFIFTCKADAGLMLGLNPQRIRDVLSDKHKMQSYLGNTFSYLDFGAV
jgi:group I intron endonuclease